MKVLKIQLQNVNLLFNFLEKTLKINKQISKNCKNFIEKTCCFQMDKRYDWKMVIEDPFVVNQPENVVQNKIVSSKQTKIDDNLIENISECLKLKIKRIIDYYNRLMNDRKVDFEMYQKYCKEMSICSMLTMLEIKLFIEFLRQKDKFFEDEEIHFLKINLQDGKYKYSYINCGHDNIYVNKENPILENFKIDFYKMELELKNIISTLLKKIDVNIDDMDSFDFVNNNNLKNYYSGDLEKYFFKLFENGILSFSKKDYKIALEEFIQAQYLSEYIIFIGLITSFKKETNIFTDLLDMFKSEIRDYNISNSICITIVTFIGGIIKTFKTQKIIEEVDINGSNETKDNSNNAEEGEKIHEMLIGFYPNILKLIRECDDKIKRKNSSNENMIKEVI